FCRMGCEWRSRATRSFLRTLKLGVRKGMQNEKVAVSILFCSSGLAQSTGAHFASIRTPSPLGRRDHPGGNFFAGARNPQATVCPVLDSDQASRFRNPDARNETREIG